MKHIEAAIKKLEGRHKEHILVYGEGNELRLTGRHETGAIDQFTYGVANRGASVRIPRECAAKGYGYFEDRREYTPYLLFHTSCGCDGFTSLSESRKPIMTTILFFLNRKPDIANSRRYRTRLKCRSLPDHWYPNGDHLRCGRVD